MPSRWTAKPLALGARGFDLLLALVSRRDRTVAKNELIDLAWPGLLDEENNLQVQISSLRKLLGAAAITTVPGRGYRFTMALAECQAEAEALVVAQSKAHALAATPAVTPAGLPDGLPDELPDDVAPDQRRQAFGQVGGRLPVGLPAGHQPGAAEAGARAPVPTGCAGRA